MIEPLFCHPGGGRRGSTGAQAILRRKATWKVAVLLGPSVAIGAFLHQPGAQSKHDFPDE
jgi:hypothetical protein